MHSPSLLYVGAIVGLVRASAPAPAAATTTVTVGKVARAIVPTVSGQIGINPVSAGLGDPSDYVGPIGTDTNLYQVVQSTTKWIGVNTEYLTDLPYPTTVDGKPATATSTIDLYVATATAAAEGVAVGDVTVVLSDAFKDALSGAIDTAVKACGAPGKKIRRRGDFLSCVIDAGQGAAQNGGGAFDLVTAADWEKFALDISQNAPAILRNAWQLMKTKAQQNKFALYMGALVAGGYFSAAAVAANNVPPVLKFKGGKVGGSATATATNTATSTTSSACDPSATGNENSYPCDDSDCTGKNEKCTTGPDKGCACVEWTEVAIQDSFYNQTFGEFQDSAIQQAMSATAASNFAYPTCFLNTDGDNFAGKPRASPSDWCVCSSGSSHGTFPKMTVTNSPCAYTTMPTNPVSISLLPNPTGPVTSCRAVTTSVTLPATSTFSYCTCNDDSMHAGPTVVSGTTTCIAPDATTTTAAATTTTVVPLPQDTAQCGNSDATFSKTGDHSATNTITNACKYLVNGKFHNKPGETWSTTWFSGYTWKDPDSKTSKSNEFITIDVGVNQRACPNGDPVNIDFAAMGQDACVAHFQKVLDCPNMVGINYAACMSWSINTYA